MTAPGRRRAVLAWRDFWIEEAAFALDREAKALWVELDAIPKDQSLLDSLFRNRTVERSEALLHGWVATMQRRLPDAALSDLGAVLRAEAAGRDDAAGAAERLDLATLPSVARLRDAARTGKTPGRETIATALTGGGGSVAAEVEAWLHRLCAAAIAEPGEG